MHEAKKSSITPDEDRLTGSRVHLHNETQPTSTKRRNACQEVMPRTKKPKGRAAAMRSEARSLDVAKQTLGNLDPRNGLSIYIEEPESNPGGRVVEFDDDFVVIRDKFPKASIHLLLLPRDRRIYLQHPLVILSQDSNFLAKVQQRITRIKALAASELRRQFGHLSVSDFPRHKALESMMSIPNSPGVFDEWNTTLPQGRDWVADIKAGVHTHPSMNHLHIHIISQDMQSAFLKHKKHYLSFTSSFFVQLDELPLKDGSSRYHPGNWPKWDMKCWRCGTNFQNRFANLKAHLNIEFEEWKQK